MNVNGKVLKIQIEAKSESQNGEQFNQGMEFRSNIKCIKLQKKHVDSPAFETDSGAKLAAKFPINEKEAEMLTKLGKYSSNKIGKLQIIDEN